MASVQVYNCRGHQYARIMESYRDPITGKPKARVLKPLGRVDLMKPEELEQLKTECRNSSALASQARLEALFAVLSSTQEEGSGFPSQCYGVGIYRSLWRELGLGSLISSLAKGAAGEAAETLVISRLADPASKLHTWAKQGRFTGSKNISLERLYRCLPILAANKSKIEQYLNKQIRKIEGSRDLSVAFYDVTTYYFESTDADILRNFGYSKDQKVNQVQVVMGLLIDREGIPVAYDLFPGNTSEFKTLEPIMRRIKEEYGVKRMVVVADRGLNSKSNLALLKSLGYEYVMAYKIRGASKQIQQDVLEPSGYIEREDGRFKWKERQISAKVKVNDQVIHLEDKLLITWSAKRAAKDKADRERLVNKAQRLVESKAQLKAELAKGGRKYVQLSLFDLEETQVDQKRIQTDETFDGYYAIQCSDQTLGAEEILESYRGLWKIEESFRVMKSNLESRPIYVWTQESIQGHFVVCYVALVIQRLLESRLRKVGLNLGTERIQEAIQSATATIIETPALGQVYLKNTASEDYAMIREALGLGVVAQSGRLSNLK